MHLDENYFVSIFVAGVWSLCILIYAWNKGFFRPPQEKGKSEPPLSTSAVFGAFFIFIGVQVTIGSLFSHYKWKDPVAIIASGLALWAYIELFPRLKRAIWRSSTFVSFGQAFQNFSFGVLSWFVCYPLVMLINQLITMTLILLFDEPPADQLAVELLKGYLDNPYQFSVMALLIVVIVPTIEEVLFRGFLQTRLNQFLNFKTSIIITSLIFALFHFTVGQGLHNIGIISALFLLSCFLGFIYERQNSLLAPIGLHCTFNAFTVFLIFHSI